MTSETAISLTATDRVLVHLRDHRHHAEDQDFPLAITQKGISDATGLQLTHVPRTLKALEERGLLSSVKGHVAKEKRRYKVYFLTENGMEEAKAVLRYLGGQMIGDFTVNDMLAARKGPALPLLMELAGESVDKALPERMMAGPVPDIEGFINREHELGELNGMLEDPKNRLMVIYGSQGYGASALAAKFCVDSAKKWSVAWVSVQRELLELTGTIMETISGIAPLDREAIAPKKLAQQLDGKNIILVLDCYYEVSEEVVEFLSGLVAALKAVNGFRLLVTARENTPSYNRFYTIIDQHDGTVGEVHIRGLDIEHCKMLLGTPDIDPDSLKRLFLFTRGKPPTLKLLAKGDEKELRQHTSFSPEEIKLMLFLKGQKTA